MHSYKHTIVHDLDEVIVPNVDANLVQMMERITDTYNVTVGEVADFHFKNSFFFTDHPYPDMQRLDEKTLFKYRNRKAYKNETLPTWPKSITNPQLCRQRHPHSCPAYGQLFANSSVPLFRDIKIEPNIGTVHQYQPCPQHNNKRRTLQFCLQYFVDADVLDNRLLDFVESVNQNVKAVKSQLDTVYRRQRFNV